MLISRKGHTDTIQVYSVTVMTHVKALQAGHSSQGTSEPITPDLKIGITLAIFISVGTIPLESERLIMCVRGIIVFSADGFISLVDMLL